MIGWDKTDGCVSSEHDTLETGRVLAPGVLFGCYRSLLQQVTEATLRDIFITTVSVGARDSLSLPLMSWQRNADVVVVEALVQIVRLISGIS